MHYFCDSVYIPLVHAMIVRVILVLQMALKGKFSYTILNNKRIDNGYPHDGRVNKNPYLHDSRADKDSYPHDSNNQCIIQRLQLSLAMINVQLMLV